MRDTKPIPDGAKFGRLTIIRQIESVQFAHCRHRRYLCRCDCGKEIPVTSPNIKYGRSKSCGCLKTEITTKRMTKHGQSKAKTAEYYTWKSMIARTTNPDDKNYCGRGITVCERWQGENGFANFFADMGHRPSQRHSIDRKDNDGNYEPDNCRWATRIEQSNNRRNNIIITWNDKTLSLAEWATLLGVPYGRLKSRVKMGWSHDQILSRPPRITKPRKPRR